MLNYLINSFKRKLARRVTKEYSTTLDSFETNAYGTIKFANWNNPLVEKKDIPEASIAFFKKFINEGDLVIDIGANIGHTSVPMSIACGKTGLTLSFDPNPFVFKVLEQNATLNLQLSNIQPFNFAITDFDDEFFYTSSEASFNNGGISKEKSGKHGKYVLEKKIKGINLEAFLKKNFAQKLPKLRFIKIDTEGYDKEIIKSIRNILIEFKPIVVSECFFQSSPADRFEHFEVLSSIGYSLFYFNDFELNTEIVPILQKEDMLKWKHYNFYAINQG
ncbi:FkbM family methyltransferase [Emticicia sp. SJ17W-69]|uniref:FkbM family methyltransferase n=1 Tax=Emticicia sp. SJ17W-69 TaxID=3421657 RepID=UPI003EBA7F18